MLIQGFISFLAVKAQLMINPRIAKVPVQISYPVFYSNNTDLIKHWVKPA